MSGRRGRGGAIGCVVALLAMTAACASEGLPQAQPGSTSGQPASAAADPEVTALERALRRRPFVSADPDAVLFGEGGVPLRDEAAVTADVARALAQRSTGGRDPVALAAELMSDPALQAVAPPVELRGALALFTGTIAEPVLVGLRAKSDPQLAQVRFSFGSASGSAPGGVGTIGSRLFTCDGKSDVFIEPKARGSTLASLAVVAFHELLHSNRRARPQPDTSRHEHVTIFWLQGLFWAQEIAADPAVAAADDFATAQANSRLLQQINSGDRDLGRGWFDPAASIGDTSSWSTRTIEPSFWRLAVLADDVGPPGGENPALPAVLEAAGIAAGAEPAVYDAGIVDRLAHRGTPLTAGEWSTVIDALELEPLGLQIETALSGGAPPAHRKANEWVHEEGAQRELAVTVTNTQAEPQRNVEVFVSDSGSYGAARVEVDAATARVDGSGAVPGVTPAGTAGPTAGTSFRLGDLAPDTPVRLTVAVALAPSDTDGLLNVRVGSDAMPLGRQSAEMWTGGGNAISILQPWSADQSGTPGRPPRPAAC